MSGSEDRSHGTRAELLAIGAFCAITFAVPLVVRELYPFSTPTMFSFQVEQCCVYHVIDHEGQPLSLRTFGLQLNNPHDPPVTSLGRHGYGRKSPFSIHNYGAVAPRDEVVRQVQQCLLRHPELPFVLVRQAVIGPIDSRSVGLVGESTWQIDNPLDETRTSQRLDNRQR